MKISELRRLVREELGLEETSKGPGAVWGNSNNGWSGRSPKGEVRSFSTIASAQHWAKTGQTLDKKPEPHPDATQVGEPRSKPYPFRRNS